MVKVVATLGPSTDSMDPADFARMLDMVDGVRINMSHATPRELEARLKAVRAYEAARGRPLAVIADLRGGGARVGETPPVKLDAGSRVRLRLAERGDGSFIPVPSRELFRAVEPGDVLVMLDGRLRLRVLEASPEGALAVAESGGLVERGKAVAVEGKDLEVEVPTAEDLEALRLLAAHAEDVDYLAASLVSRCNQLKAVAAAAEELGLQADLMAKVETAGAVKAVEELASCSHYLVVARGDLGVHYGLERLPKVQRRIVEAAQRAGRPVAVATQLLDSMRTSPVPTRAEVHDVYTTASMAVDSLWLTNETAAGGRPLEAVEWLNRLLAEAEPRPTASPPASDVRDRFAKAVVDMAEDLGAPLLVYSMTGTLAKRIARYRPSRPVVVGTPRLEVARRLALLWGLQPVHLPAGSYEEGLARLVERFGRPPYVATYGVAGATHVVRLELHSSS